MIFDLYDWNVSISVLIYDLRVLNMTKHWWYLTIGYRAQLIEDYVYISYWWNIQRIFWWENSDLVINITSIIIMQVAFKYVCEKINICLPLMIF